MAEGYYERVAFVETETRDRKFSLKEVDAIAYGCSIRIVDGAAESIRVSLSGRKNQFISYNDNISVRETPVSTELENKGHALSVLHARQMEDHAVFSLPYTRGDALKLVVESAVITRAGKDKEKATA